MKALKKIASPLLALAAVVALSIFAVQADALPAQGAFEGLMRAAASPSPLAMPSADPATAPPASAAATAEVTASPSAAAASPAPGPVVNSIPMVEPTPTPLTPINFLKADLTGAEAHEMERLFGAWGFRYSPDDGKWTAADAYELSLFQRWAGLSPSGKMDTATRRKLEGAYLRYGEAEIPRKKLALEGRFIGINPGHQKKANYQKEAESPDPGSPLRAKVSSGTQGVSTRVPEYVVNLAVALKLRDRLEALGARVLLSRTTHDVNISNAERARRMNEAGVQVFLSLHCDGNANGKINGLHTLIPSGIGYQRGDVLKGSQKFAHVMQEESIKATGARDKGFSIRSDLCSLNWAKMPVCLVEMGYMTNVAEDKKLVTAAYQDKLAAGFANAFVRYFKEIG